MKKRRIKTATVAGVAATTLLVGGVTACNVEETGSPKEGQQREQTEHPKEGKKDKEKSQEGGSDSTFNDGQKDVTMKSCSVGDPFDLGEQVPVVDLSIKNNSSKVSDYLVEIEVTNSSGKRLETLLASADHVSPGQVVDTGKGDGEEDPPGTRTISEPIKCQIVNVDRMASVK